MRTKKTIKHLRESLKLSKAEFAEKIGVAPARVYEWEIGKRCITIERLQRICDSLEMEKCEIK